MSICKYIGKQLYPGSISIKKKTKTKKNLFLLYDELIVYMSIMCLVPEVTQNLMWTLMEAYCESLCSSHKKTLNNHMRVFDTLLADI